MWVVMGLYFLGSQRSSRAKALTSPSCCGWQKGSMVQSAGRRCFSYLPFIVRPTIFPGFRCPTSPPPSTVLPFPLPSLSKTE